MDPNANIAEQDRIMAIPYAQRTRAAHARLRELRAALDEWRARGGFDPEWGTYPRVLRHYTKALPRPRHA
jgi:hypothetical protein